MNPILSFFLMVGVMGRPYPPVWTYNYGIRPAEPQFWQDVPAPATKPARQNARA
jgi:hypothetical protein